MAVSQTQRKKPVTAFETDVSIEAGYWAIGATGAVGAKTKAIGLKLTRTGAGLYTVQLIGSDGSDAFVPFILHADFSVVVNDADPTDDTDAIQVRELTRDASTGTMTLQCLDEGGVSRDPASGALLSAMVVVGHSNSVR